VDGGVSVYDNLMQLQADLIGRPVRRMVNPEGSATGAASLGWIAAGRWKVEDIEAGLGPGVLFQPAADQDWRDESLARWHDALARSRLA
jgi:glycerol kinase